MVEGIQVAQVEVSICILLAPSHRSSGCSKQAPWGWGEGRGSECPALASSPNPLLGDIYSSRLPLSQGASQLTCLASSLRVESRYS